MGVVVVLYCCRLGGSLDKHRNIPEHILGPISVSIVRGLQYLWSLKIMHRGLYMTVVDNHKHTYDNLTLSLDTKHLLKAFLF